MKLAILGSTGSIGRQTLSIIDDSEVDVVALSCHSNTTLLLEQCRIYQPEWVNIENLNAYEMSKHAFVAMGITVTFGNEGLVQMTESLNYDVVITAVVGAVGLLPTIAAIKRGKRIALANKETLVIYGRQIMALAKAFSADIIPVDSEHSAIFQSLQGNDVASVEKLILTATGGPFLGNNKSVLKHVRAEEALNHPKWAMGKKITIDSATLMNKGLEVIEARWLFDVSADQIDVVVHPECIIHSLVQYHDSSIIAQLGLQDMQLPIHYALNYPQRLKTNLTRLNLVEIQKLNFYAPDKSTFPCLQLAYDVLNMSDGAPCVLNAANEILVEKFLMNQIGFYDIPKGIEKALTTIDTHGTLDINSILEIDKETRKYVATIRF